MTKAEQTSILPLRDRIVVAPLPKDEVTLSGILIPDSAKQDKPEQGTVIAVGPGVFDSGKLVPMTLKAGDTILFSKYGYKEVKVGGKEYFILSESEVLAVLK